MDIGKKVRVLALAGVLGAATTLCAGNVRLIPTQEFVNKMIYEEVETEIKEAKLKYPEYEISADGYESVLKIIYSRITGEKPSYRTVVLKGTPSEILKKIDEIYASWYPDSLDNLCFYSGMLKEFLQTEFFKPYKVTEDTKRVLNAKLRLPNYSALIQEYASARYFPTVAYVIDKDSKTIKIKTLETVTEQEY